MIRIIILYNNDNIHLFLLLSLSVLFFNLITVYELRRYKEALANLNQGKNFAEYSVKSTVTTDEGKEVTVDVPQTELIKEAEKYITKVEKKLKELEKA